MPVQYPYLWLSITGLYELTNVLDKWIVKLPKHIMRQIYVVGRTVMQFFGFCRARVFSRSDSVCVAYYSVSGATDRNRFSCRFFDQCCSASLEDGQVLKRS